MVAMNNPHPKLHPCPRQGIGALFVIAVGVITVLAAIVGINQFSSMTSTTRDTTAAIEMTHKTTLVAESAVDEGAYGTLALDLNNPDGPADGLYLKIRSFLPALSSVPAANPPVFAGATPFIHSARYAPVLTYEAMQKDEALKLSSYDADANPVHYGPLAWNPITSQQNGAPLVLNPASNESMGVMGFAHTVYSKGAGFFKDLDQSVQFSRPYKCLLMAPPWPYTKYALFVLEFYGDTQAQEQQFRERMTMIDPATTPTRAMFQKTGSVRSAFAGFYRKMLWHNRMVELYKKAMELTSQAATAIPTAGINIDLNSPIVFEGTIESSVLDPLVNTDPAVAELRNVLAMPAGYGFEDGDAATWILDFGNQGKTAEVATYVQKLVTIGTALKSLADKMKVRNVTPEDKAKFFSAGSTSPAYNSVVAQAWMARATRIYKGPADLKKVMTEDGSTFQLDGVYYFQGPGPYTLDKLYSGKGILVFEDSVTVGGFNPDSPQDSHAVVVAVPAPGKTDANSILVASEVTADLVAPYGTVSAAGSTPANPTAIVRGSVIVRYLADAAQGSTADFFGSAAPTPMFPNIDRGNKAEYGYEPPQPGSGTYDAAFAKHMRVFFDPGYVRKLYWSRRD